MVGGVPLVIELNSGRRGQSFPFTGLPGLGILGMTETKHGPGWRHSVSNAPSRTQAKQSIAPPPFLPFQFPINIQGLVFRLLPPLKWNFYLLIHATR